MPGRISIDLQYGSAPETAARRGRENPMRVLLLGDFSGRGLRAGAGLKGVRDAALLHVDLDTFDEAFTRLMPALEIDSAGIVGNRVALQFESLDDFHPDRLFARLGLFRDLREQRERLLDPATFAAEADRVAGADLLGSLLGSTHGEDSPPPTAEHRAQTLTERLIRQAVDQYAVRNDPRAPGPYVAAVDAIASERMRDLLHAPEFQALESAWRGLRWIVDSLELGDELQVDLLDITANELLTDMLASKQDPSQSSLHQRLARQAGNDAESWSHLIWNFTVGAAANDLRLLGWLGAIGASMGATVLAAAASHLAGCPDLGREADPRQWSYPDGELKRQFDALRAGPTGGWIGLALPRVLLRAPYGARGEPIDAFQFEEILGNGDHEDFLWGNPAYACAVALGRAHLAGSAANLAGQCLEIDDLPAYVVERDGERQLVPCAEHHLGEAPAACLQQRGLIPLLSYRNRNALRIGPLRAIGVGTSASAGS